MANRYLESGNKDKSSTRLYAAILLMLICVVVLGTVSFGLFHIVADGNFIKDMFYGLVTAFIACVTAGKAEGLLRKKPK